MRQGIEMPLQTCTSDLERRPGSRASYITSQSRVITTLTVSHGGVAQGRGFVSPIRINVPGAKAFADAIIDVDNH